VSSKTGSSTPACRCGCNLSANFRDRYHHNHIHNNGARHELSAVLQGACRFAFGRPKYKFVGCSLTSTVLTSSVLSRSLIYLLTCHSLCLHLVSKYVHLTCIWPLTTGVKRLSSDTTVSSLSKKHCPSSPSREEDFEIFADSDSENKENVRPSGTKTIKGLGTSRDGPRKILNDLKIHCVPGFVTREGVREQLFIFWDSVERAKPHKPRTHDKPLSFHSSPTRRPRNSKSKSSPPLDDTNKENIPPVQC
jgi:hypothetical protein